MKDNILHYQTIFRAEPEGGFTIIVPSLPGCVSYGRTLAAANANAQDAVTGYVKSLRKHGEEVPTDEQSFVGHLEVKLSGAYA